jgi:hypothetical protein
VALFYKKKNFNKKAGSLGKEKKLFTIRTFLTALCRRPYPGPPSHMPPAIAPPGGRPRSHWVIWVIWVTVLNRKLAPVAGGHWVIWVIYFA